MAADAVYNEPMLARPIVKGMVGTIALLAVYFTVVSLISGWGFALDQFTAFWYFIISLAVGFGIQVGLFTYLKATAHTRASAGKVVAISGTTSTVAMISCCAHYAANILPILGITGALSLVGQYQIQLFWVGLVANALGIAYITRKIIHITHQ